MTTTTEPAAQIAPCTAQRAGMAILDTGPHSLPMLASIFYEMHPDILASCWLALFLDAMDELGAPIADIARALHPVVVKLNHRPARGMRRTPPKRVSDDMETAPARRVAMPTAAMPVEVEDDSQHDQAA